MGRAKGEPLDELLLFANLETRRAFLKKVAGTSAAVAIGPGLLSFSSASAANTAIGSNPMVDVRLKINGSEHQLTLDPRTSLLDIFLAKIHLSCLQQKNTPCATRAP